MQAPIINGLDCGFDCSYRAMKAAAKNKIIKSVLIGIVCAQK